MKVTIFTPTYNRASYLNQIFDALCRQTDKRFEWLIIDDGSTDNTAECVEAFRNQIIDFNIRYFYQNHSGKPSAQNKAIELAEGELFITCDSNKFPADDTVELIIKTSETINNNPYFCGIGGYRANKDGYIWGGPINFNGNDYIDCTRLEHEKYNISGDKSTAFYTDILKKYKSPEFPNEDFVSEIVWLYPMAVDGYKTRWLPKIFIYGEYAPGGLTMTGANSRLGHEKNFMGFCEEIKVIKTAKGLKFAEYLLYEAMDIAKYKNISDRKLAKKTGSSLAIISYLRLIRTFHKIYGIISSCIKKNNRYQNNK